MITCFPGWTYEYIDDHVDIPRLRAINSYQRQHPPVHILVAAFMGVKGDAAAQPASQDVGALAESSPFIPNQYLTSDEFNAKLKSLGLPIE